MKALIIRLFLLSVVCVSFISCSDKEKEQLVQAQLDSAYNKLKSEYASGARLYGKYKSVNIHNDMEFEYFVEKVVIYIKNNQRNELSKLIRYPMDTNDITLQKTFHITNENKFLKYYEDIFNKLRVDNITNSIYPFAIPVDMGSDKDDKRVLAGKNGDYAYERANEKGMETYKVTAFY